MGNCCRKTQQRKIISLLLVGLDNAGKTVAAHGLIGESLDSPIPTVGFAVTELKFLDYKVKIFDLGGSANIRNIWQEYFVDVHGVIFVIDSTDCERFPESRRVLEEIVSNDKVAGKPLLILANKQDCESAIDEIDLIECFRIEELVNQYKCPALVQSCSANENSLNKTDAGIRQGFEWIVNNIHQNYNKLNRRVEIDMVEQDIKTKQEILDKLDRIKLDRLQQDPDAIQTVAEYLAKQPKEIEDNSSRSSITFPEIYYIPTIANERPKTAVQLVKHQLQLRRTQSAKVRRNKTAPINHSNAREFLPTNDVSLFDVPMGEQRYSPIKEFELTRVIKVRSKAQVNYQNGFSSH